jgi:ATP-binding protein involved in chromosome partitioning
MFGSKKQDAVTQDAVMKALSTVQEPELHQDLVTLNMIRDLTISGGDVGFTIVLTTPACPLRGQMEQEAIDAVKTIGGVNASTCALPPTCAPTTASSASSTSR